MAAVTMERAFVTLVCLAASGAMGFLLVVLLVRYFVRPFRSDVLPALCPPSPGRRRRAKPQAARQVFLVVGAAFLASRLFVYVAGLVAAFGAGHGAFYLEHPLSMWMRWDANHYVGLAQNWYVNQGDARLHLVFFPLFPLITRGLHLLLRLDAAVAGTIVSNLCLVASGWALYRLVEMDQGGEAAKRAVRFLMFAPMSFFLSIPYSESLFLLLCLVSALLARRRKMGLAVLVGALAANARVLGLLSAVPIYYEYLNMVREKKGDWRLAVNYALRTLPVALGFGAYLLLNQRVSGDPLMFLTYQSEHWSQQMGSLWNTLQYTLSSALRYDSWALQLGTWIPQAAYILAMIALLTALYRRVHPSDGAYALLYIYLAVSPTWLLSGPRYLTAMYALYPMLAMVTGKKRWEYALYGLCLVLGIYFIYMYLIAAGVM